jgi:hypothetical protein
VSLLLRLVVDESKGWIGICCRRGPRGYINRRTSQRHALNYLCSQAEASLGSPAPLRTELPKLPRFAAPPGPLHCPFSWGGGAQGRVARGSRFRCGSSSGGKGSCYHYTYMYGLDGSIDVSLMAVRRIEEVVCEIL